MPQTVEELRHALSTNVWAGVRLFCNYDGSLQNVHTQYFVTLLLCTSVWHCWLHVSVMQCHKSKKTSTICLFLLACFIYLHRKKKKKKKPKAISLVHCYIKLLHLSSINLIMHYIHSLQPYVCCSQCYFINANSPLSLWTRENFINKRPKRRDTMLKSILSVIWYGMSSAVATLVQQTRWLWLVFHDTAMALSSSLW